jgi:hypothetical protein
VIDLPVSEVADLPASEVVDLPASEVVDLPVVGVEMGEELVQGLQGLGVGLDLACSVQVGGGSKAEQEGAEAGRGELGEGRVGGIADGDVFGGG